MPPISQKMGGGGALPAAANFGTSGINNNNLNNQQGNKANRAALPLLSHQVMCFPHVAICVCIYVRIIFKPVHEGIMLMQNIYQMHVYTYIHQLKYTIYISVPNLEKHAYVRRREAPTLATYA
jgi:hypothetical protein